ncbi:MAG: substrate-binding domain-containing protein [Acidobacteria bacterium]|nr:substrate-binding domain-containing protein [Acidobacteriota bacterium]
MKTNWRVVELLSAGLVLSLLFVNSACRRKSAEQENTTITVYGFSVAKEPLLNEIIPAFVAEWRDKTGQQISFESSFAGSEIVTNQIINGVDADVAILAIERNAERMLRPDVTRSDWHKLPYRGIVNQTPMVIVTRQGNPKRIRDFNDLGKPGVQVILCDPTSSGAGNWALVALYGSELLKTEAQTGNRDSQAARNLLKRIAKNIRATPESARAARALFEHNEGDALITYELEALQMRDKGQPMEIILPPTTVMCEHPVVIIDHLMSPSRYALVELFVRSLWERPAQEAWTRARFRSVIEELNGGFPKVEHPFKVGDLGGWGKVTDEVINGAWKEATHGSR